MGELRGFMRYDRRDPDERSPGERVGDHREFVRPLPLADLGKQGARCMECGVPFCHHGCPLGNLIPEWNDLVYRDRWREASEQLHRTNNFPEQTGRLCPAPCEAACVLEIDEGNAVTIKQIERAIADRAWEEGWVVPQPPHVRTGRRVAVVGSGPAGLACAQQLNRAGHRVTVFERDEAGGGLVRFGIPDFKIEKHVVESRLGQLAAEGIELRYGVEVGVDVDVEELRRSHDALVLATGARVARDLPLPGRELEGVEFAMDYLYGRNRAVAGTLPPEGPILSAAGKDVVVIGGGDTGADCIASAHREGAASVTQIDIHGEPPPTRTDELTPWPQWPMKLRMTYALKEGGTREFAITVTHLSGRDGRVERVHWARNAGTAPFEPLRGTEASMPAGLVLLAIGFAGPETPLLDALGIERTPRGNADAPSYATVAPGVFAAGDARRGQSLIVWAINEGRECAEAVERWLASSRTGAAHAAGAGGA